LDRPASFLLDDNGSRTNPATTYEVAYFKFDDVATAQLTIDCKLKHRPVA
jgi:hypothetical protein